MKNIITSQGNKAVEEKACNLVSLTVFSFWPVNDVAVPDPGVPPKALSGLGGTWVLVFGVQPGIPGLSKLGSAGTRHEPQPQSQSFLTFIFWPRLTVNPLQPLVLALCTNSLSFVNLCSILISYPLQNKSEVFPWLLLNPFFTLQTKF